MLVLSKMVEKKENGDVETEEQQITDWNLPLTFTKNRHTELIEGVNAISQTWRMKERVCIILTCEKQFYLVNKRLFSKRVLT